MGDNFPVCIIDALGGLFRLTTLQFSFFGLSEIDYCLFNNAIAVFETFNRLDGSETA